MRVITFKRFREHVKKHPDCENALSVIEKGLKKAHFENVNEVNIINSDVLSLKLDNALTKQLKTRL